jgi:hypothetical protein
MRLTFERLRTKAVVAESSIKKFRAGVVQSCFDPDQATALP